MNSLQLNDQLLEEYKCFIGTFPIDEIPNKKFNHRPIALIANLDEHYKPGSHWVALYIDENNVATYFDSFGSGTSNKYILDFLKQNRVKTLNYNSNILQSFKSMTCGVYCILFVKMRCAGFSMYDILKLFSKNTNNNDKLVVEILE